MPEICLRYAWDMPMRYVPHIGKISILWDSLSEGVSDRPGSRYAYASNNYIELYNSKNKTKWSIALALKWSIFIVQKLVLHKNGVEFCQQFNGAIRTSLTGPHDDGRRRARLKTLTFFNPSPSSWWVTDLEAVKGAASGAAECTHVLCIYWLTVRLLHDQLSSSVHNL